MFWKTPAADEIANLSCAALLTFIVTVLVSNARKESVEMTVSE